MDISRIRAVASTTGTEASYLDRHFLVVARLVPKKNLFLTLDAYAEYVKGVDSPRMLHIAGNGALAAELQGHAALLGISPLICWHGFVQEAEVYSLMMGSLALLLLSTEEQFGNVVTEAQSLRLPVIVSINVGARDHLVRTGINGFVVEPDNVEGTAYFMRCWVRTNCYGNECATMPM